MDRYKFLLLSCLLTLHFLFTMIDTSMMYRTELCDAQARITNKCMTEVSKYEDIIKCCVRCGANISCIGASVQDSSRSCYLHKNCASVSGCTAVETGFTYFQKNPMPLPCVHGSWDGSTGLCKCSYNYVGDLCERRPYNCTEFFDKWKTYGNSFVALRPIPMTFSTNVICRCSLTSLETVIIANSGGLDFNKTWYDYGNSFFTTTNTMNNSFWLGLPFLPLLLGPNGRNIRIDITFTGPETISHRYTGVVVGDASTNYQFSYLGHTSLNNKTGGNCLELSNMTSFSTWDMDNDGDNSENWAMRAGAGWWFPAFNFTCNPMGTFYGPNPFNLTGDGYVHLPDLTQDDLRKLKRIEMVIEEDFIW